MEAHLQNNRQQAQRLRKNGHILNPFQKNTLFNFFSLSLQEFIESLENQSIWHRDRHIQGGSVMGIATV